MKTTLSIIAAIALVGCTTTEPPPVTPPVTEIGRWSGPDVALMVHHWDRMCAQMGQDGPLLRSLCDVVQEYSEADVNAGSRKWGPASCDHNGCWHGIAYTINVGDYKVFWPKGRHEGVIAHEMMHPLQNMLIALDSMPRSEMDEADPKGHPKYMTVDGRRFKTANVVDWRWPSVVETMIDVVNDTVWDGPSCGTGYEVFEKGGGI